MKSTKAFQLKLVKEPITVIRENNVNYPLANPDDKEIFIHGKGRVKIGKCKRITVEPLTEYTAENIQKIYTLYGYNVVLGLIKGWGNQSLFHDNSYGLDYHKFEIMNMCRYGKPYDIFTDKIQAIGDKFVATLLLNGFRIENETVWVGDKICGFLDRLPIHPLAYIEHCFRGIASIPPSFNSIDFDDMLVQLISVKEGIDKSTETLEKVVSVKDRITYLTNQEISNEIESIFELQNILTLN